MNSAAELDFQARALALRTAIDYMVFADGDVLTAAEIIAEAENFLEFLAP